MRRQGRTKQGFDKALIAAIREGLEAAERGELKPAEQVFAEMKARRDGGETRREQAQRA